MPRGRRPNGNRPIEEIEPPYTTVVARDLAIRRQEAIVKTLQDNLCECKTTLRDLISQSDLPEEPFKVAMKVWQQVDSALDKVNNDLAQLPMGL